MEEKKEKRERIQDSIYESSQMNQKSIQRMLQALKIMLRLYYFFLFRGFSLQ